MSTRVTVVGSINTDDAIRLSRLPGPGETVGAHSSMTALGGKGANQAVAAVRAGASVRMAGAVGAADGAVLLDFLARDGIDIDAVARLEDTASGRAVVLIDDAAENCIVVVPGANHAIPAADVDRACAALRSGEVLLLQNEVPAHISARAARRAREAGAHVIWNAAPAPVSRGDIVADLDLLVVNEHELVVVATLLDTPGQDLRSRLADLSDALGTDVVCTLGSDGAAYHLRGGESGHAPAPRVSAVDTTAAGDTFTGYLAALHTLPFEQRLRAALAAASLAVTRPGAAPSIPRRAELEPALFERTSR
ncbi:ribokinase [Streptomyces hebeiensis]|uniref:Ribokinase n=1 Tax=Streptomyces hebeiensis TaxID=229486 RepID=A0ABN1V0G3_9ACTN